MRTARRKSTRQQLQRKGGEPAAAMSSQGGSLGESAKPGGSSSARGAQAAVGSTQAGSSAGPSGAGGGAGSAAAAGAAAAAGSTGQRSRTACINCECFLRGCVTEQLASARAARDAAGPFAVSLPPSPGSQRLEDRAETRLGPDAFQSVLSDRTGYTTRRSELSTIYHSLVLDLPPASRNRVSSASSDTIDLSEMIPDDGSTQAERPNRNAMGHLEYLADAASCGWPLVACSARQPDVSIHQLQSRVPVYGCAAATGCETQIRGYRRASPCCSTETRCDRSYGCRGYHPLQVSDGQAIPCVPKLY